MESPDKVAPLLVGRDLEVFFDVDPVQGNHGAFHGLSILADDLAGEGTLGQQGGRQQKGYGGQCGQGR